MRWLRRLLAARPGLLSPEASDSIFPHGTFVSLSSLISLRQQCGGLKLDAVRKARSAMAGGKSSRFRGRGMDYDESRNYQHGDDIRAMDWRVTARTGQPHVKVYTEERERPVFLVVDFNPGMFFASTGQFKSVQAAEAAALIAWAATSKGDRVGGLLFNGHHLELEPRGGSRGALDLIRQISIAADPAAGLAAAHSGASMSEGLKRLRRVAKPGSLVFIVSDFYEVDEDVEHQLKQLRQHNDVVAIHVYDRIEVDGLPDGRWGISDGDQRSVLDIESRSGARGYHEALQRYRAGVHRLVNRCGVPLIRLATHDDVVSTLRLSLGRARSRGKGGL